MSLLRRKLEKKVFVSIKDLSQNDCYAIAYYLYILSKLTEQDDNDIRTIRHLLIDIFLKLAAHFNTYDQVAEYCVQTVTKAENTGSLHRLPADGGSERRRQTFCTSDIFFAYEEDMIIERRMPDDYFKIDMCAVNLYRCLFLKDKDEAFISLLVANFLLKKKPSKQLTPLKKIPSHIHHALDDMSAVQFLTDSISLTPAELKYLLFSWRCMLMPQLQAITNKLSQDSLTKFRSTELGMNSRQYTALFRANGALRSFGFIDESGDLKDETIDSIANQSLDVFFDDLVKEADCSNAYDLDSFNVNKEASVIMRRMLCGTENISLLLYGKPGSGKTEYARALAAASGLKPLIFRNEAEMARSIKTTDSVLCRLNLLLAINRPDTVLIIDEADTLLKTKDITFFGLTSPAKNKGTVNTMLDTGKNKIIWIVNFTSQIDDSTLRRFNFSYKFESMSREQLRSITSTKLMPLHLPRQTSSEILGLMERYSVTGASVDNVVKTIRSLGGEERDELINCVQTILKENALLINGKAKMRETVGTSYDKRALNVSTDPDQLVQMIRNAQDFAEENHCTRSSECGIRILFYGVSGTGKTEFARYIAQSLGKKILLKRASDILDKYVGGTEQNIKDAFEEADRTGSILLFDEADSFFADRNSAHMSWERTQVNEFLTQMEEFGGIMICTTNLKHIMDAAMNRRFHLIVEFKPLTRDGIQCMLEQYFSAYTFSEEALARLARTDTVTPGDFGVLASRIRFMNKQDLSAAYIIDELCRMQDEKEGSARIGF